jgi:hypothetical protein
VAGTLAVLVSEEQWQQRPLPPCRRHCGRPTAGDSAVNCLPDSGAMRSAQKRSLHMDQQRLTALELMQDGPVIPVIVLNDPAHAVPMAQALVAGGVRVLEVTLRTPQGLSCIEAIARAVPEAIVGAGTVRSAGDAQACANAGARFAVSPGYTSALGRACQELRLPLLPGWPPAAKSWPPRPMVSTN